MYSSLNPWWSIWASTRDFSTYRISEQRMLRRVRISEQRMLRRVRISEQRMLRRVAHAQASPHQRAAHAQASLHICADSPEHAMLAYISRDIDENSDQNVDR